MNSAVANETNSADQEGHGSHPKPTYDDVNIPVVVLLGILSAILTFVSIAFVQGLYYSWTEAMVLNDWNSGVLTPQEETIVEQKEIRDGFFKTKNGKVYVSAEWAAREIIGGKTARENSVLPDVIQPEEKNEQPLNRRPEPPGPDQKNDAESNSPSEKSAGEAVENQSRDAIPVKQEESKTGKE